jgi:hypothetical protein
MNTIFPTSYAGESLELGSGGMFNLAIVHFSFPETEMMSVLLI